MTYNGGRRYVRDLGGNVVSVDDAEAPSHTHTQEQITDFDHSHTLDEVTDYTAPPTDVASIGVVLDAPEAADVIYVRVPFACNIVGAYAVADQAGDLVVDVWKDTFANFPPTDADSITASAPITLSTAQTVEDTTLTGWTVALAEGDWLAFNVDSVATITQATVLLAVERTA